MGGDLVFPGEAKRRVMDSAPFTIKNDIGDLTVPDQIFQKVRPAKYRLSISMVTVSGGPENAIAAVEPDLRGFRPRMAKPLRKLAKKRTMRSLQE